MPEESADILSQDLIWGSAFDRRCSTDRWPQPDFTSGTGADSFSGGSGTGTATDFTTAQGEINDNTIP
jgi:hypothetical protein